VGSIGRGVYRCRFSRVVIGFLCSLSPLGERVRVRGYWNLGELVKRARQLRQDATLAEKAFWRHLRGGHGTGLRFRRQHPIGPYIVDFFCSAAKLVIELDSWSHDDQIEYDLVRERFLISQGYSVLRLPNMVVLADPAGQAQAVVRRCEELRMELPQRYRSEDNPAAKLDA